MEPLPELLSQYRECREVAEAERLAEEIIEFLAPDLSRFIRSHFSSNSAKRDAWEDAYQETLAGIVDTLPAFGSAEAGSFLKWCYGLARHKIADQFRGRKTAVNTVADPELLREALEAFTGGGTLSAPDRADLEAALALIEKSEPPCLNYLWDRYVVGLSFAHIGEAYGITEGAATKRVQRCLQLARRLLKA